MIPDITFTRFDPSLHDRSELPDSPGVYAICLRDDWVMPPQCEEVIFEQLENMRVLYVGIAGTNRSTRQSLRKRHYQDHFEGNNAGKSTLRKSLGVLFGYALVPRDKNPARRKTKFADKDERALSAWMKNSLILFVAATESPWKLEHELITRYNPPLNLGKNTATVNAEFRAMLSKLRRAVVPNI